MSSFNRAAYDVAWNWFRVHADQRMDLFRTYIVWVVALSAGYVSLIELKAFEAAMMVAIIGVLFGWLFKRLDERVAGLLKNSERALKTEETKLSIEANNPDVELVAAADRNLNGHWTYRRSFNALFVSTSALFLLGVAWAIKGLVCS